jgi:1,4-alpha-glucan branching enzyme
MCREPVHRRYHHNDLTFGFLYAFDENFILPLSHDEVVHGKGSLLNKMSGDDWQRFANLRAYFGFMFGHPGKKLLFMGSELAQCQEWDHDSSLDWGLAGDAPHEDVQRLIRDLNQLYCTEPALHEWDCQAEGFAWLDLHNAEQSVLAFMRRGRSDDRIIVVICNFTPEPRPIYRLGVPLSGSYRQRLNTDAAIYGRSDFCEDMAALAEPIASHGRSFSLNLTLPPLATLILERDCP